MIDRVGECNIYVNNTATQRDTKELALSERKSLSLWISLRVLESTSNKLSIAKSSRVQRHFASTMTRTPCRFRGAKVLATVHNAITCPVDKTST